MRKNSKRIGNAYEREFAKSISEWLTGNKDELVVWRNIHSGSVGTIRKKKGLSAENVDGDLQILDLAYKPFFDRFYFDTKTFKSFNSFFINPRNRKSNVILEQWKKVCSDCPDSKIPVMVCNIRDGSTPEFICIPDEVTVVCDSYMKIFVDARTKFNVYLLTDFFSQNTWKNLLQYWA